MKILEVILRKLILTKNKNLEQWQSGANVKELGPSIFKLFKLSLDDDVWLKKDYCWQIYMPTALISPIITACITLSEYRVPIMSRSIVTIWTYL
jgi:hypothetical protein